MLMQLPSPQADPALPGEPKRTMPIRCRMSVSYHNDELSGCGIRPTMTGHQKQTAFGSEPSECGAIVVACHPIAITILIDRHSTPETADGELFVGDVQRGRWTGESEYEEARVLKMRVDRSLAPELLHNAPGPSRDVLIDSATASNHPLIDELSHALAAIEPLDEGFRTLCVGAVREAIGTCLPQSASKSEAPRDMQPRTRLSKWRLKRVEHYVEEHFAEKITLADLARAAGLTRMYFAGQFRSATGMRPHDFILRKRIGRAQDLLLTSDLALVEIAHSVGFQAQAHFTSTFKRFVGETPHRWRLSMMEKTISTSTDRDFAPVPAGYDNRGASPS
jgi:AraC-like DNA-binding protein